MLLSVVVPVYNVEEYLTKCVNSILEQTYKEFEIILVNDGSTDNSPEICNIFAVKDSRVKVIHKENGGLSSARNAGILASKGKYVVFIDSDDYIIENSFEILLNESIKYDLDIVCGNRIISYPYKSMKPKQRIIDKVYSGEDFLCENIVNNSMPMCAPYNIYKRELICDNGMYFKDGLLHEDELWTPQIFLKATKVKAVNIYFYIHIIRTGSITQSENKEKNAKDLVSICYELENIYRRVTNRKNRKVLNDNLMTLYLNAINIGNLYYTPFSKKGFLIGKALGVKSTIKAILFIINRRLYRLINRISNTYQ
jgi:glycosyltransferase involved in cell wall biosynthesis